MEKTPVLRHIEESISQQFFKGKVILLLGPRQVGKSTLIRQILKNHQGVLWLDAENADVPPLFKNPTSSGLRNLVAGFTLVVIDEAQKIADIGKCLKLMVDYLENVQVIATGSSAFDLRNSLNEPLTGRKWEYYLYPFSFGELVKKNGLIEEKRNLFHRLVYGTYPEVVLFPGEEKQRLRLLADSYLYKDLLMWSGLKKPEKLLDLLKALSFQLGNEVSYNELGNMVGLKSDTVESYIQLLEQSFVLFRLPAYSSNHRKELRKGRKVYFYDNGIRNALIGDFRPIAIRQDMGALWENWVISELWKKNKYDEEHGDFYFWRTQDQQEIDLIIEKEGMLNAFEIKWNEKAKVSLSKTFSNHYPNHRFAIIHPSNVYEILLNPH